MVWICSQCKEEFSSYRPSHAKLHKMENKKTVKKGPEPVIEIVKAKATVETTNCIDCNSKNFALVRVNELDQKVFYCIDCMTHFS